MARSAEPRFQLCEDGRGRHVEVHQQHHRVEPQIRHFADERAVVLVGATAGSCVFCGQHDLRCLLANLLQDRAALANTAPDFVPGVVSAMRANPAINDAMRQVHTTTAYRDTLAAELFVQSSLLESQRCGLVGRSKRCDKAKTDTA